MAKTYKELIEEREKELATALGAEETASKQYLSALDDVIASYSKPITANKDTLDTLARLKKEYIARPSFDWNPQEDATAREMNKSYLRGGSLAARDVLGKTAAMTGGLASSYGQQVAQQTYGDYMQTYATEVVPQLEAIARAKYDEETQKLASNIDMLQADADAAATREANRLAALNNAKLARAQSLSTSAQSRTASAQSALSDAVSAYEKESDSKVKSAVTAVKNAYDGAENEEKGYEAVYNTMAGAGFNPNSESVASEDIERILIGAGVDINGFMSWLDAKLSNRPKKDGIFAPFAKTDYIRKPN